MKQKTKQVSERVRISNEKSGAKIVISGVSERWKVTALTAWIAAWLFCGAVVIYELLNTDDREMKLFLVVFLVFWAYFMWKISRVWHYRKGGYEAIDIGPEQVTVIRKTGGPAKTATYKLTEIGEPEKVPVSEKSFTYIYEDQWWVLGGERIGFKTNRRYVRFGMQLDANETAEILRFMKAQFRKARGN